MIPSGHYRPGRLGPVDLAVVHTSESDTPRDQLAAYFASTDRRVSCHSIVDDTGRLDVLPFTDTAYAAPGANADGDQLEVVGFARWTRDEWLTGHPGTVEQAARWLAERCRVRALPAVLLSAADLRRNARGITGHAAVSEAFHLSTHTDPGPGWPWDVVLHRVNTLLSPAVTKPAARPVVPRAVAPAYPGRPLSWDARRRVPTLGAGVLLWQRQMRRRGWTITVDGVFGPASATVAAAFQRDKHLHPVDGIVGPVTWAATWATPVT